MIYLDHNATTPVDPEVVAAMLPFLGASFGNPSSAHRLGSEARCAVEDARDKVAALLGVEAREIVFTSGGTEANNLALQVARAIAAPPRDDVGRAAPGPPRPGVGRAVPGPPRHGVGRAVPGPPRHVVSTQIEHSSVLAPLRDFAERGGRVTFLPVDGEGRVTAEQVAAAIDADTTLVSVGWANNEIGTIQPLAEIADVCRARGVRLHSDAVQAAGKLAVDASLVDLLSVSAHKLGGPKGVGALCVRSGLRLEPALRGGAQERERRAGTENVAGIVGFGAACERAVERLRAGRDIERLRELLWAGLASLPGAVRNSPAAGCLPNTLNVSFRGRSADGLVAALDLEGVAVSAGSACAAGASEPSHVLRALGRGDLAARDAIRLSLGPSSGEEEIRLAVEAFRRVMARGAEVAIRG